MFYHASYISTRPKDIDQPPMFLFHALSLLARPCLASLPGHGAGGYCHSWPDKIQVPGTRYGTFCRNS